MSVYTAILPGSVKAQVNEQTVYHKDGEGPSVRYWNKQNCEILSIRYKKSEVRHAFWHKQSENVMQHRRGSSSGNGKQLHTED